MKVKKVLVISLMIAFFSLATCLTGALSGHQKAHAEDAWQKEFEAVCSQTDVAMDLTKDQLKQLIDRCDRLKPIIQKQDEIQRRVYLKRLDSCRDFYRFMLESKEK